jgi:DGQHR domain-containing protein
MKTIIEGTRLKMGERELFLATIDAPAAVQLVAKPDTWNPLAAQPHGNRVRSKEHVAAIKSYLVDEPNPILNSLVIYPRDGGVTFAGREDSDELGLLEVKLGTLFDVGDGQHRLAAIAELLADLRDEDEKDPVRQRIYGMKLPVLVVLDADPVRRAQDFVDLQRNSKPPAGSLGASMDRRHPLNRFALDVAKRAALFDRGNRIEFLSDTIGKRSVKLYSFQAFRQATGILLAGSGDRTRAGFESAGDTALAGGKYDKELTRIVSLIDEVAMAMPGWSGILEGEETPAGFREKYLHATAAGLYAIALSLYQAREAKLDVSAAVAALAALDWVRTPDEGTDFGKAFFDGTLLVLDPKTDSRKTASGRPSWEAAADKLLADVIKPASAKAAA